MKYTIIFALALFLFPRTVVAQNCYVRLTDASGYTPAAEQIAALEQAAAALCAVFDSAGFGGQFKVYDFGFYLHNEKMIGEYPEMFQSAIMQVETQCQYYLLFGKQTESTGIYTKFWVALKLPNQDIFYCIDQLSPSLRGNLTAKHGIIANAVHDTNEKAYFRYHEAEIATIDSLRSYITALKECCIPPGQQRRGPSCTSCAFSKSEFASHLRNKDFTETICTVQAVATSNQSNSNTVNRIIQIGGEAFNVDMEIQKFIESYKGPDSSKSVSVYTFAYPDQCSDLTSLLETAEGDSSCLVIVAGVIGDIGEDGFLFLKTFEKSNCLIKPNGPGYIYIYDMQGNYKINFWGNHYHGIYFTDSPYYLGRIDFKKKETKGDAIAKFSSFFISDANITYLKYMQEKCNTNKREYGGLVSTGGAYGELIFEECTWCSATAKTLNANELLTISNYSNYKNKDFISVWHTHPNSGDEQTQWPSSLISALQGDYSGDFFVFKNRAFTWQGSKLGADASAENTWRLPGRIGIIAGELGVTIFRFVGDYYEARGPSYTGNYSCEYHPTGLCYLRQGTIESLDLKYSWIKYNLSQKKP